MTLTREKLSLSLLLAGFILVMTATRYHHFGSVLHMPDASLAVFFFAGLYLKKLRFFAVFLATAGIVDFLAIRVGGVSDYCMSPAYVFLVPTYWCLWAGGQWYARFHKPGQLQLPLLLASALVTGSAAFVISNASFYLLSGVTPRFVWTEYLYHFVKYYPPYLSGMLFYVSIVVLAYFLFGAIRRTPRHTLEADS